MLIEVVSLVSFGGRDTVDGSEILHQLVQYTVYPIIYIPGGCVAILSSI